MSVASVEDSTVYSFALRVAILAHQLNHSTSQPSNSPPLPSPTKSSATTSAASLGRPGFRSSVTSGREGWSSALSSFGDAFSSTQSSSRSDPTKAAKLPKEFVKAFTTVLAAAEQHPPPTSDSLFRQSLAAFRKEDWTETFRDQLKADRKVEGVILRFVTRASAVVRREEKGDQWKGRLNEQVGAFVGLIRQALSQIKGGPTPELLARLDTYTTSFSPDPKTKATHTPRATSISTNSVASSSALTSPTDSWVSVNSTGSPSTNLSDMHLVRAVGSLFVKTEADLTRDVTSLRRVCTDKAAYADLKLLINNLAQGGGRASASRADFDSDEGFAGWKKDENAQLQEMLLAMLQRAPELVMEKVALDDGNAAELTFVPPDPKACFKRLFEIALEHDYDRMKDLPPDEDVSLTILSEVNEELLRDCEVRWRVMPTVKPATFLSLIAFHYQHQGVPEACVVEALAGVDRLAESGFDYDRWPWADRAFLFQGLSTIFDTLLTRFFEVFQGMAPIPFSDVVDLLEAIHANQVFAEDFRGLPELLAELGTGMREFVRMAFEEKQADIDSHPRANEAEPFLALLDWIKHELKAYDKQFPQPLLGTIDVPELFVAVVGPEFVSLLASGRNAILSAPDDELLGLYRATVEFEGMHNAFVPHAPIEIEYRSWFEPFVLRWLSTIDTKTNEWVQRAIEGDKFEPEGDDGHSSSIVDLIASCKSAADFLKALDWPDEEDNARYITRLSQTIAKSIEGYSNTLETLFLEDMFPKEKGKEVVDQDVARPSAWLTKAKLAVQGDKKVDPFVFRSESCVKLNNIQAARGLLDSMYNALNADHVSSLLEQLRPPPAPSAQSQSRDKFLFTVKIVLGENLALAGASTAKKKLDPFLILSDQAGYRVAKTRTLYETNDPRWDETVDVSVTGELWVRATVYSRNLVDDHDKVGYAYIHLAPAKFADFLTQDVWYRLEDANRQPLEGRLLLRISMEGEKDDIRFYFGRAFRSLKRAETDMARTMVDKMSPFVRHYLSHATLKQLVKGNFADRFADLNVDIDFEKVKGGITNVSGKLNAMTRDLFSNEKQSLIPPVEDRSRSTSPSSPALSTGTSGSAASKRKQGRGPLTDVEIEDAVGPLLDYFDQTFPTLKQSLSPDAWELVIGRLWKEILSTLEALILPPLSDRPTEMRPLSDREVDIVFKWLGFLVNFFHGGGEGVEMAVLRGKKYQQLLEARMYYDWSEDALMEEAVRSMQRQLAASASTTAGGAAPLGRTKSVYQQRNLGTIKARKTLKRKGKAGGAGGASSGDGGGGGDGQAGEVILRILRMHPGAGDFLRQQLSTLARLQADEVRARQQAASKTAGAGGGSLLRRAGGGSGTRGGRGGGGGGGVRRSTGVPPVPSVPQY